MKTRNVVLLAVAGAVVFFIVIGGGIGAFVYFAANGFGRRPPDEGEKKLILTTQALGAYTTLDPKCERLTSKRGLDGAREIEAEYRCGEDTLPQFTSTAEIARTMRDARESYRIGVGAYKLGSRIGGATLHEMTSFRLGGDEQFTAELHTDHGIRIGYLLVVRKEKIVLSLLLVGVRFEDANDLKSLMQPLLEEAAKR